MKSPLDLAAPGFVLPNARFLVRACARTYAAGPDDPAALAIGFPDHAVPTLAQAILTAYDDCLVLAFRGTHNLHDWLTDADFPLRPTAGGRVHAGFLRALDNLWPAILAALAPHGLSPGRHRGVPDDDSPSRVGEGGHNLVPPGPDFPPLPLLITGHSLGGALAVLCASRLARQNVCVHSVHTFGQPRVGDRAFAAAYDSLLGGRTFRVVNRNDVVPRLPGVLLGYRHVGHLGFLTAAGRLVCDPALLTLLASDLFGLARAWRQWDDVLVTGHFVDAYRAALDGASISRPFFSLANVAPIPSSPPAAWPL